MQGNPEIKKAKWSKEEDERLMELMQEHKGAWALIARHLPGRTDQQCMVGFWIFPAKYCILLQLVKQTPGHL